MRHLMAGLAALLLIGAAAPAKVEDLGWLEGRWGQEQDGRWTEESWTGPRGGVMLGYSRSGRGESLREFEFLRLQVGEDGVVAYIAQPGGAAPVAFRLGQHDGASATFENAAHDYPQRIRYVREGERLTATISKIDGSGARSWVYMRR
jgi:hypothetical protein